MALDQILNPPKRVQFLETNLDARFSNETVLGGVIPDILSNDNLVILTIDATVRQQHSLRRRLPTFPIEQGMKITDDAKLEPKDLVLDCVISDTPMDLVAAIGAIGQILPGDIGGVSPSVTAWNILKALMGDQFEGNTIITELAKQPFDVSTGLEFYRNMMLESVSVPRSLATGKALRFTVNLKEIIIVSSEIVPTGEGTGRPIGSEGTVGRGRVEGQEPAAGTSTQASNLTAGINP